MEMVEWTMLIQLESEMDGDERSTMMFTFTLRKGRQIWRKSRLEVHLQKLIALCLILKISFMVKRNRFSKNRFWTVVGIKRNYFAF